MRVLENIPDMVWILFGEKSIIKKIKKGTQINSDFQDFYSVLIQ